MFSRSRHVCVWLYVCVRDDDKEGNGCPSIGVTEPAPTPPPSSSNQLARVRCTVCTRVCACACIHACTLRLKTDRSLAAVLTRRQFEVNEIVPTLTTWVLKGKEIPLCFLLVCFRDQTVIDLLTPFIWIVYLITQSF